MIGTAIDGDSSKGGLYRGGLRHRSGSRCVQRKLPHRIALRGPHQLPDRHLAYPQPLRNRAIAQSLALQSPDETQPLPGNTSPAATPPFRSNQSRHPSLLVTLLVSPNGALGYSERTRHLRLLCKARFDQHHHRVRFGHRISGAVVVHR